MTAPVRLPSCSEHVSLPDCSPPPCACQTQDSACLPHSLGIYVSEITLQKLTFQGCLARYLRTPGRDSSVPSTQVFLQSRKDWVWQEQGRDFQKEQRQPAPCRVTQSWPCAPWVTADPSPPPLEGILLTEMATFPAARSLLFHEELMSFSASADLVPWNRKPFQKGKAALGCHHSNDDLARTCYAEQFRPDPCFLQSRCSLTCDDSWNGRERPSVRHSGGGDMCGSRTINRNFMHVTGVKLSLELRVRNT